MSYRIAGAFFVAAGLALLGLAYYAAFLAPPWIPLPRLGRYEMMNVRYVAGWALLAAFLAGTAYRYCSNRARGREPSAADALIFQVAKVAIGIAAILDLAYLLIPLP